MPESQRLIQLGTVGTTPVMADVTVLGSAVPVTVTLLADYQMLDPPGYPARPSFTGCAAAALQFPRTIPKGTPFTVLSAEAAALNSGSIFPSLDFSNPANSQYLAIGLGI